MAPGTVTLVLAYDGDEQDYEVLDTLSDEYELAILEAAVAEGREDPLGEVYRHREQTLAEEEEFGDYVEELITQPFVRPEVKEHGVQWMRSKIKIEEYQRSEAEAAQVISEYAYRMFKEQPDRADFIVSGPEASVRVRVVTLAKTKQGEESAA